MAAPDGAAQPASEGRDDEIVTAAVLIIGDEILSGRTKDKNIGFIADYLTAIGIDLREARIVPDIEAEIVDAVRALSRRYTYVFTCGGIGPTHDDITADAIAAAFEVEIGHDPRAVAILEAYFAERGIESNEARLRMARIPAGADLIENRVSRAPGFRIGNVHVMAGVPSIMQAMMDAVAPTLKTGRKMLSETVPTTLPEGTVAGALGRIQAAHPDTIIGSYPYFDGTRHATNLVIRARDAALLATVADEVRAMVAALAPAT
ncbi:competence/damage-inducible protein A [Prosthecodimorpha staleyi]|uniref:Competence/damage-inducible protein A n=1 Tax=Prosthecodimorpha staleyi TaxID=2840188 RepID=A0A947GGP3_9HYPH|nr:molybdopterin-binding protein [Prosthecodimorpha staleyi]MBT9292580.1 competence/damage-inducible protein A [Prosthecodimorpha staleyi]